MKMKIRKFIFALIRMSEEHKRKRRVEKCQKLYDDFSEESPYDDGEMKFIWGVKSFDDLCSDPPCLYTMNDIDVIYLRDRKKYILGIETAYRFDDKRHEVEYLERLLGAFTQYMQDAGLSVDDPYRLWMSEPQILTEAESIPELYTNFKIFVGGYKSIYANERK